MSKSKSLFSIGDKVVYPMHGAGVVQSIEEREILGQIRSYYVINIPTGDIQILVPMDNVESVGLREIIDADEASAVLDKMRSYEIEEGINWNRRYRDNLGKIKTGDVYAVADVVRSLMIREDDKGLSAGERKMLDNARQVLISELALARGLEEDEVFALLTDMVAEKAAELGEIMADTTIMQSDIGSGLDDDDDDMHDEKEHGQGIRS